MKNSPVLMLGLTGLAENVIFMVIFMIAAGIAAELSKPAIAWAFVAAAVTMLACAFIRYLTPD